jgi:hypothetical protein
LAGAAVSVATGAATATAGAALVLELLAGILVVAEVLVVLI